MLSKALRGSLQWSLKWFFGSFTASTGLFFVFYKSLSLSLWYSIGSVLGTLVIVFSIRVVVEYIALQAEKIGADSLLIESHNTKIIELEKDIDIKSNSLNDNELEISKLRQDNERLLSSSSYGQAIIGLTDIFSKIHSLRKVKKPSIDKCINALGYMCNGLKKIFEDRNGFTYSVSVKILESNPSSTETNAYSTLLTLCRDDDSLLKRNRYKPVTHNILENTCFLDIFQKIDKMSKAYYVSNSLPAEKIYRNSSFKIHGEVSEALVTHEERSKAWTLPYKSELVVPIHPFDEAQDRQVQFIGYLCVDCNMENAFDVEVDLAMVKGVADGIFDVMKQHKVNK